MTQESSPQTTEAVSPIPGLTALRKLGQELVEALTQRDFVSAEALLLMRAPLVYRVGQIPKPSDPAEAAEARCLHQECLKLNVEVSALLQTHVSAMAQRISHHLKDPTPAPRSPHIDRGQALDVKS